MSEYMSEPVMKRKAYIHVSTSTRVIVDEHFSFLSWCGSAVRTTISKLCETDTPSTRLYRASIKLEKRERPLEWIGTTEQGVLAHAQFSIVDGFIPLGTILCFVDVEWEGRERQPWAGSPKHPCKCGCSAQKEIPPGFREVELTFEESQLR